jgi:ankyrin repeat protein
VIERETSTIRLTHFTLQEYFGDHRDTLLPSGHTIIAEVCLTYLAFKHTSNRRKLEESSPFIEYIGSNLGHHLRKGSDTKTDERAQGLLNNENKFSILGIFLGRLVSSSYHSQSTVFQSLPLHWVAFFGVSSITRSTLEVTDNANVGENYRGMTPLGLAAETDHEAVVNLLVNTAGVNLNSKDWRGRTPLALAAQEGREAVVKLLVNTSGVELNPKDQLGQTPLTLATKKGHEAVVKLLFNTTGVDLNPNGLRGRTPLALAAENGREAVVKLLVDTPGVNLNSEDGPGRTPFALAAEAGHKAVVKVLVNTPGVDLNPKSSLYYTPLILAARNGHEAVVRLLINTPGVDLNPKDKYGRTPLDYATRGCRDTIIQILQSALDKHRSTNFIVTNTSQA